MVKFYSQKSSQQKKARRPYTEPNPKEISEYLYDGSRKIYTNNLTIMFLINKGCRLDGDMSATWIKF
ncbi:hypothetical protein B0O95_103227 [Mycetohabitans endofungorum]|uniref:Uncharacterized protein n=1 Tax=Mycetohabitans endofungorum TaxID=417203 RepID=A0A2P5KCY5_9BURK|nr:hypothetical protein B0O95_103227 [Mycetohabitans endofungorum]